MDKEKGKLYEEIQEQRKTETEEGKYKCESIHSSRPKYVWIFIKVIFC